MQGILGWRKCRKCKKFYDIATNFDKCSSCRKNGGEDGKNLG